MRDYASVSAEVNMNRVYGFGQGPPNNGMHPTPHDGPSYGSCIGARVMRGVGLLRL
jgi:hypothetical protein